MADAAMETGVLVLRINVPTGQQKRFSQWYESTFAPAQAKAAAVTAVRRFTVLDGQANTWVQVDIGDIDAYRGKAMAKLSTRTIAPPFDVGPVAYGLYRQIYPQYNRPGRHGFDFARWRYEPPAGTRVLMTVGYGASKDETVDAEFNSWYQDEHIPQVLSVPGIITARRFRFEDGSKGEPEYLALYDIVSAYTFYSEAFVKVRHSPWLERVHGFAKRHYRALYERVS
ncbi:MAG: hypothetical protein HYX97_04365 [Chloroflexi bacterium]|nr:hypothetical protein [Chloroflexota bacterium]